MTNLIGIAPISSPTFSGVSTFDIINVGSTSIPTGTPYKIAVASAAKATSLTITGSFTMTSTSLYYVSGTGIATGTTLTNAVAGTDTTVITLSAATTASLTTSSTITISEVPQVSINLFSSGQSNSTSSIVSYGGDNSLLSGTLDINASKINLNGSSYINGTFYVKNTFNLTGAAGSYRSLNFETDGTQRFAIQIDNTPESGSNTGSNLSIASYDDTGAWLSTALSIDRATGNVNFPNNITVKTQSNDDNSTYPATTAYVQNQFTKSSISLGPVTDIGTSTTYTVASAADSGVTSIDVTGQITYQNWYGYAVSGTGIAPGTQITDSVYDSTAGTSTITLSLATTAALTTTSTIDVDMIIGTALQFHSNGSSNYDAEISSVGGGSGDLDGILNITAGGVNFNSSGVVNFSSSKSIFTGPLYSSNTLNIGSVSNTSARTINFLTSGNNVDYDVQLYASDGGTSNGEGALSIIADSLNIQSTMNIMQPSFNLGLNQSKEGATFINFFSNGNNTYADATLQSYGGTTGAAGGGTFSINCGMLSTTALETDLTSSTNGVLVPTPTNSDSASQKVVNMAYLNSSPTLTGGVTLDGQLNASGMIINGSSTDYKTLYFQNGGANRWTMFCDTGTESGNSEGSDFNFNRQLDDGTQDTVYTVKRDSGAVSFISQVNLSNNLSMVSGTKFGNMSGSYFNLESSGHISVWDNSGEYNFYWSQSDGNSPAVVTKQINPMSDNDYNIGFGSARYGDIYASNGAIQTSDVTEKNIQDISPNLKDISKVLKLKPFTWKNSVEEKGDKARIHHGYMAQDVENFFVSTGEDPSKYGVWCNDKLTKVVEEKNEKGEVVSRKNIPDLDQDGIQKERQGVRYTQLHSILIDDLSNRLNDAENKIDKLTKIIEDLTQKGN